MLAGAIVQFVHVRVILEFVHSLTGESTFSKRKNKKPTSLAEIKCVFPSCHLSCPLICFPFCPVGHGSRINFLSLVGLLE